jgi:hypothetical protein
MQAVAPVAAAQLLDGGKGGAETLLRLLAATGAFNVLVALWLLVGGRRR